ncbi:MAG: CHASE2 domain-containing protein, partial [Gammaproteobacteria bacterium]
MKRPFWYADWFVALAIVIIFLLVSNTAPLAGLERGVYDWGVQSTVREPSPDVAVIAIDDDSIAQLGRWPWPRDLHAALIDVLTEAGAKVVVYTVFFTEPQQDPGLLVI